MQGTGIRPFDLETVTEARLVAEALAGSQSAFENIVRRYQGRIIRLVARITGDRALAEDLAQETFVKAFRSLAAFDVARPLSSWLLRIAHNTALDSLRRRRRVLVPIGADGADASVREPAAPRGVDPVERAELARDLHVALSRLRPEYRAAIALRYEEDLPFEDIGVVLGVPAVTARSFVHRARKELSRHLSGTGWEPRSTATRDHERT